MFKYWICARHYFDFYRVFADFAQSVLQLGLKHLQRIQLTMNLTKSTYSDDRAAYYQGPWEIRKSGVSVAAGNIVAFKKPEIVPELVRQVQYFFDNAI